MIVLQINILNSILYQINKIKPDIAEWIVKAQLNGNALPRYLRLLDWSLLSIPCCLIYSGSLDISSYMLNVTIIWKVRRLQWSWIFYFLQVRGGCRLVPPPPAAFWQRWLTLYWRWKLGVKKDYVYQHV